MLSKTDQFGLAETLSRGERANLEATPKRAARARSNESEIGRGNATGGDGHSCSDTQHARALSANNGAAVPLRRKRTISSATPTGMPTVSAPIETRESARKRATRGATPIMPAPASDPIPESDLRGDPGQSRTETQNVAAGVATITTVLAGAQRRRKFCIKQQSQADRSIEAMIATTMGFLIDATEKERKQVFARAKAHRLAVEKGGEGHGHADTQSKSALAAIEPFIRASARNRRMWDALRDNTEASMVTLARQLPVYAWAKSVKGFGELGLAIIYGEAGEPIELYRTIAGLWKRMGLAVIEGERQQKKTDKTLAAAHAYSPRRRSEIWTLADSMSRSQWNGARTQCAHAPCAAKPQKFTEDSEGRPVCEACSATGVPGNIIPAHAAGPYGGVYGLSLIHI